MDKDLESEMPELYDNGGGRRYTEALLKFATDHNEIVMKFGRYPHRNEAMGRESTPEEEQFIKTSDRDFGN